MKIPKLLLVLLLSIITVSLKANNTNPATKQTDLRQEIVEYQKNADLTTYKE
jgi:hypothetical protein